MCTVVGSDGLSLLDIVPLVKYSRWVLIVILIYWDCFVCVCTVVVGSDGLSGDCLSVVLYAIGEVL